MKEKPNPMRLSEGYAIDNRLAAVIYLANPALYPGVMQEWARLILTKPVPLAAMKVKRGEQISLINEEVA